MAVVQPGRIGRFEVTSVGGDNAHAYVPPKLPPTPPLDLSSLQRRIEHADQALGRLDGIASVLPNPALFVFMYVRKEAVLSSQIEGTQSSLSDLLLFELPEVPGVPLEDVREVSNYVGAMSHGLERLVGGFPMSLRLIREVHGRLLSGARGGNKEPGEFRRSQNWIGGTRPGNAHYVPPPPHLVMPCMAALELFLHDETDQMPIIVKAGLAHVQFESIHPFLDGNGRLGRLLITFLLCDRKVLSQPLLYLSLYLKQHRARYYALLQAVRERGEWEIWLEFFLDGVIETAEQAAQTIRRILTLFDEDRATIEGLGRAAGSVLRIHEQLKRTPIMSVRDVATTLALSQPTVAGALTRLAQVGIVREVTGQQRHRRFVYDRYLDILNEGTESIPA